MNPTIILIVNIRSLLLEGVENLLKDNGEFIVNRIFSDNYIALAREIEQLKPQVIITDEITSFAEPVKLIALLQNIQNMRLIVVNNRENTMEIYDKFKRAISNSNQFIDAISLCTDGVYPE